MPKAIVTLPPSPAPQTALACQSSYQPQVLPYRPPQFSDGLEFKETGLVFTKDITKEEWKVVGAGLRMMGKAWLWWLGDWINYGEKMYSVSQGEREKDKRDLKRLGHGVAIEAAQITGYSPGFISDVKSVCLRVALPWRHSSLTVHHAREILQAVPDAQFPFWAHRIVTENLSTREVRIELRRSLRTETPSPSTTRPSFFAQEHTDFVRKFMAESENWTEAEWQAHAAWHEPILKAFRSRGL